MLKRRFDPSKRQLLTRQQGVTNQKVCIFTCIWNLSRSHIQSGSEAHKQHRSFTFTYHTTRVSTGRSLMKSEPKFKVCRHSTKKNNYTGERIWSPSYMPSPLYSPIHQSPNNNKKPVNESLNASSYFLFVALWPHFGSWPPIIGFAITLIGHTTLCRTPLDEWSARTDTSTWQYITLTRVRHPRPRRESNPQFQQADPRLRRSGHWDRLLIQHPQILHLLRPFNSQNYFLSILF